MATPSKTKARRRARGPRKLPNPAVPIDVRAGRNRLPADQLAPMSKPELRRRRRLRLDSARYQRNAIKAHRRAAAWARHLQRVADAASAAVQTVRQPGKVPVTDRRHSAPNVVQVEAELHPARGKVQ